ncbi:MAG: hypothetical protein COB50_00550 [Thiotrichales bacterium]|nr:MAG: hypothetical protein COB50_00550 [Thiotrichales bacterium]
MSGLKTSLLGLAKGQNEDFFFKAYKKIAEAKEKSLGIGRESKFIATKQNEEKKRKKATPETFQRNIKNTQKVPNTDSIHGPLLYGLNCIEALKELLGDKLVTKKLTELRTTLINNICSCKTNKQAHKVLKQFLYDEIYPKLCESLVDEDKKESVAKALDTEQAKQQIGVACHFVGMKFDTPIIETNFTVKIKKKDYKFTETRKPTYGLTDDQITDFENIRDEKLDPKWFKYLDEWLKTLIKNHAGDFLAGRIPSHRLGLKYLPLMGNFAEVTLETRGGDKKDNKQIHHYFRSGNIGSRINYDLDSKYAEEEKKADKEERAKNKLNQAIEIINKDTENFLLLTFTSENPPGLEGIEIPRMEGDLVKQNHDITNAYNEDKKNSEVDAINEGIDPKVDKKVAYLNISAQTPAKKWSKVSSNNQFTVLFENMKTLYNVIAFNNTSSAVTNFQYYYKQIEKYLSKPTNDDDTDAKLIYSTKGFDRLLLGAMLVRISFLIKQIAEENPELRVAKDAQFDLLFTCKSGKDRTGAISLFNNSMAIAEHICEKLNIDNDKKKTEKENTIEKKKIFLKVFKQYANTFTQQSYPGLVNNDFGAYGLKENSTITIKNTLNKLLDEIHKLQKIVKKLLIDLVELGKTLFLKSDADVAKVNNADIPMVILLTTALITMLGVILGVVVPFVLKLKVNLFQSVWQLILNNAALFVACSAVSFILFIAFIYKTNFWSQHAKGYSKKKKALVLSVLVLSVLLSLIFPLVWLLALPVIAISSKIASKIWEGIKNRYGTQGTFNNTKLLIEPLLIGILLGVAVLAMAAMYLPMGMLAKQFIEKAAIAIPVATVALILYVKAGVMPFIKDHFAASQTTTHKIFAAMCLVLGTISLLLPLLTLLKSLKNGAVKVCKTAKGKWNTPSNLLNNEDKGYGQNLDH